MEWIQSVFSSFEEGDILYLKLDTIIMATHPSLVPEISLVKAVPKPACKTALSDWVLVTYAKSGTYPFPDHKQLIYYFLLAEH